MGFFNSLLKIRTGQMNRTGVLLIGSSGYIATAVITGILAERKGLSGRHGMVTELEAFSGLDLINPGELVIGGWDIRAISPVEAAYSFFKSSGLPGHEILPRIEDELKDVSSNLYRGVATNCGRTIEAMATEGAAVDGMSLREQAEKLKADIRDFKERNALDEAVVVNLASTEPPLEFKKCHETAAGFEACLDEDNKDLVRASTLYAYAAVTEGCPYINFTPSNGALAPAIIALARENNAPVMGDDGKTGETLVKSALIPMFLYRNLEVLSWEGFNILGNMDGKVLNDPENRESKILSKDRVLGSVLGYSPHSGVHIHYVPSLDDQKTAWNFIHFRGFFGAKMSLQFIWQGYDSLLAAPLILDLVRLSELSKRRAESGPMTHLASFFKAPLGVKEYRLYEQFKLLFDYAGQKKKGPVLP